MLQSQTIPAKTFFLHAPSPTPILSLLLLASPLAATDGVWVSTNSSSDWDNSATNSTRWQGGVVANGAGAVADFSQAHTTSNSYRVLNANVDVTLGQLILGDSSGTNLAGWQLTTTTAKTLTFNNNGSPALLVGGFGSSGGNLSQIASPLQVRLEDSLDLNAATVSAFNIFGPVTGASAGSKVITNIGTGTGAMALNGVVSDGAGVLSVVQSSTTSTLVLRGANTYSGGTTVTAGTLRVDATTGSATGSGAVTVLTGGTLTGRGSIAGATAIQAGGAFAPGIGSNSGLLSFGSSLTLFGTSTFDISGTARGTEHDAVNIDGLLIYGGNLIINFRNPAGEGDSFNLFGINGGYTGNFASVTITGDHSVPTMTLAGGVWSGAEGELLFQFDQSTGTLSIAAIPEPATCAVLVGLAALGFAAFRRRR